MSDTIEQAREVIEALQSFVSQIVQIENLIGDKDNFTREERETLNELLISLKRDVNNAAKRQTVNANKKEPNAIELHYFIIAINKAECRLQHIKVRTNPLNSNWLYHLDDAKSDIVEQLLDLKKGLYNYELKLKQNTLE